MEDEDHLMEDVPEEKTGEISQEDAWAVISAFFDEKGLVRQQLDSFNEFICSNMQEIVDEYGTFVVKPEAQHNPGMPKVEEKEYKIEFLQIYLSKPTITESDGETSILFPKEARLRSLTYAAPLYVDIKKSIITRQPDGEEEEIDEMYPKTFLGEVPIMLRSKYCQLEDQTEHDLTTLGECPLDQGGYFVVNGSEKVLIAQERMANNQVYVSKKIASPLRISED